MARTITLTKVRTAKNGLVSYKENRKRSTGVIYFSDKMFVGGSAGAPETLTISGDNLAELAADAPAATATEADAAQGEQQVAEAAAEAM